MEEKIDVLNELGEFTGKVATRDECHQKGLWHRAVYAFIIDKKGNVLLQKRSENKKMWPNMWDVTVGGHVDSNEFGRQALIREVKEELGIDIKDEDIKYLIGSTSINKKENIIDTKYLQEVIVDELFIIYVNNESLSDKIMMAKEGPTVILMVGVNGVGKTTTIAKLAYRYRQEGKRVMMIAADTFRAGAVAQLEEWAKKTDSLFFGKENTDPSGVIFDGLEIAKKENVDIVFIDTAGRLQNKVNLMKELEKMNKVIGRIIPGAPHETLLVIDATTGQNGIVQAESFKEITNITGIVLTKLDGTAKGGIVLAIKETVGIPVKFIGLGEKMTDLQVFDIESYIYGLFKDMID